MSMTEGGKGGVEERKNTIEQVAEEVLASRFGMTEQKEEEGGEGVEKDNRTVVENNVPVR
jgi:hypothetical protein